MAVRLEFRSFVCSIMFLGLEQNSFFFFLFFFKFLVPGLSFNPQLHRSWNSHILQFYELCGLYHRLWNLWEDGLLWDCIKPSNLFDRQAPWRHCGIFKQCYQLDWYCMDDTPSRCLYCWHFPWSVLDFHHRISHLPCGNSFNFFRTQFSVHVWYA